ncbi:ABC transporter permease [Enorma phocaeensis]|uniref:ABC transporter permease n=1 Tax=Enorma phocaeensis TaxID=1871019 RepID=A0ABT7V9N5_9ACTN|nr:ABC transporter permease [Enorma phocaeensis]MBM6953349.1 ABC transporter permease [Enorma phocaeensis]MDM8275191.1 ABC transporter permease [Enorma phocaeensis]
MNNLLRLVGRRIIALPIMALGVTLLVFFLMSFTDPSIPARTVLGEGASPEQVEQYMDEHGMNDPWPVRYVDYIAGLVQGDLGTYGSRQTPVATAIASALPITMQLTFFGLLLAAVFSFTLGVISALYRDKWPDQIIRVISIAGIATPSFWLAVLLILAVTIGGLTRVFPSSGALPNLFTNPAGYFGRMIMPAIALAFPVIGQMTRIVRTAMVEELDKDYVQTARGGGLPENVVVAKNVLRNALITPVTTLGLKIGYLMGGAVVIEVIFALPGMGTLIQQGITGGEIMLVQGVVVVVALAFVIINIVVDMLYLLINPRIRTV